MKTLIISDIHGNADALRAVVDAEDAIDHTIFWETRFWRDRKQMKLQRFCSRWILKYASWEIMTRKYWIAVFMRTGLMNG